MLKLYTLNRTSRGRPHFDKGFDLRFNVALRLEPAAAGREAVETV